MKKTIFEGTVNGERFDNVAAYNARVNELMESGEFVSASSNTTIEEYEHNGYCRTCTAPPTIDGTITTSTDNLSCEDAELYIYDDDNSFYPYFDADDPYYLDLLVTDDDDVNKDALKEAKDILSKCYSYIKCALDDENVLTDTKKRYLEDIKDIINDLKIDNACNLEALSQVKLRRETATNDFNAELKRLEDQYTETMKQLDAEEFILRSAKPVIDCFSEFYSAIEAETMESIINDKAASPKNTNDNFCNACKQYSNKCDDTVTTEIKETAPQTEWDFNKLMDSIFGPDLIRTRLR